MNRSRSLMFVLPFAATVGAFASGAVALPWSSSRPASSRVSAASSLAVPLLVSPSTVPPVVGVRSTAAPSATVPAAPARAQVAVTVPATAQAPTPAVTAPTGPVPAPPAALAASPGAPAEAAPAPAAGSQPAPAPAPAPAPSSPPPPAPTTTSPPTTAPAPTTTTAPAHAHSCSLTVAATGGDQLTFHVTSDLAGDQVHISISYGTTNLPEGTVTTDGSGSATLVGNAQGAPPGSQGSAQAMFYSGGAYAGTFCSASFIVR